MSIFKEDNTVMNREWEDFFGIEEVYDMEDITADNYTGAKRDAVAALASCINTNGCVDVIWMMDASGLALDELTEALSGEGIKAEPVPEADTAIAAAGSGTIASDLYRDGLFSVQSLSSMLAVNALAPASGSRVLDMCAAPGGKSAMMAEMMEDTGSITACDIHEHRLDLIRATAERLGINIIETKLMDGTAHDSSLDGMYDFVLADVPCSGLGVMSTKPEIRFRMDEESMAQLPEIQLEILKNAVRYTRPGGRICYSTCTLNRSENDRVVEKLMSDEPTFGRIVEKQTVLPYNNTIGFYYCIIEKNLH